MGKKAKIALVHPPLKNVITAATPDYVDENRGHNPPMGLLYIQAAIEGSSHDSVFIDADLEGLTHKEAAKRALYHNPDIIGIQAMTFTMIDAYLLASEAKRLNPGVTTVIGGPHPTIYPRETAALEYVDYAFSGEGEENFLLFLDRFHDEDAREKVPGVACKAAGGTFYNPLDMIKDLDKVKYPARKSSRYKEYSSILAEANPITIMITSRGCPFECVFCNRMGRQYRYHSARYVLGEIEEILNLGIREIFIHDDTFSLRRDRVKEICEGIIERGYCLMWEARTRVDCVDEELLALMRKAGCRRLSFGVESGSPKVLKSMKKGIDLKQTEDIFRICRREGITTLGDFIVGNLDETEEDIEMTLSLIERINPDFVQFSILSPYPGTPLYRMGLENGLMKEDIWLDFARDPKKGFKCPVWTQNFTEEDLVRITARAYRAFYMRPGFILRQIKRMNSLDQFKRLFMAAKGMLRG